MANSFPRWMTSAFFLTCFVIFAFGRGSAKQIAPLTTQNVLVTNTSAQQVPVLPPARPTATGAYIVAVNNIASVKVLNPASLPVQTKNVSDPYATAYQVQAQVVLNNNIAGDQTDAYTVPTGRRFVIESISGMTYGDTTANYANIASLQVYGPSSAYISGEVDIPCNPAFGSPYTSVLNQSVLLVADAGQKIRVQFGRENANSGGVAHCSMTISGHLVNYP